VLIRILLRVEKTVYTVFMREQRRRNAGARVNWLCASRG
jgi:hypothetical protein